MSEFALQVKRSVCHVTRSVARVALQQELFRRSMDLMVKLVALHLIYEPLGCCCGQDGRLGQVLPGREFGRLKTRTAQPEWRAGCAWHSATIRAECVMQQRVAQAQLKWQLAEVGSDAIAGKRQSVASVPYQVGSYERLRHLVGISK